ncbi:MAG: hypothetical protein ABL958_17720 [Bdellovibrionia bacterium]
MRIQALVAFSLFLLVSQSPAYEKPMDLYKQGQVALKKGDKARARKHFVESCRLDTDGACVEAGKLSTSKEFLAELETACKAGENADCLMLAFAKLKSGQKTAAKNGMIELCHRPMYANSELACTTAIGLIKIPGDVKNLLEEAEECEHWLGEEGSTDARRKEIEKGVEQACGKQEESVVKLRVKYKGEPDIQFILARVEDEDR